LYGAHLDRSHENDMEEPLSTSSIGVFEQQIQET
jgi:hypothetical protein